jgi:hypothetical protein
VTLKRWTASRTGCPLLSLHLAPLRHLSDLNAASWRQSALFFGHDPDLWFPLDPDGGIGAEATCSLCPVRIDCVDWAVEQTSATASGAASPLGVDNGCGPKRAKGLPSFFTLTPCPRTESVRCREPDPGRQRIGVLSLSAASRRYPRGRLEASWALSAARRACPRWQGAPAWTAALRSRSRRAVIVTFGPTGRFTTSATVGDGAPDAALPEGI